LTIKYADEADFQGSTPHTIVSQSVNFSPVDGEQAVEDGSDGDDDGVVQTALQIKERVIARTVEMTVTPRIMHGWRRGDYEY
jgi:hypothetical protein